MTNGKLLKEIAKAKQVTLQELAEALGLTRQGLSKKIENRSEFRVLYHLLKDLRNVYSGEKNEHYLVLKGHCGRVTENEEWTDICAVAFAGSEKAAPV